MLSTRAFRYIGFTAGALRDRFPCLQCRRIYSQAAARASRAVNRRILHRRYRPAYEYFCTDCPARAEVYDHRSYAFRLVVEPVCVSCNLLRGWADISEVPEYVAHVLKKHRRSFRVLLSPISI